MRGLLLSLALIVTLGVPGYSWSARVTSLSVVTLTDKTHHQRDEDTRQPACAVVRCECHACPHVSPFAEGASSAPPSWRASKQWANETGGGYAPDVDVPPPRRMNVESG